VLLGCRATFIRRVMNSLQNTLELINELHTFKADLGCNNDDFLIYIKTLLSLTPTKKFVAVEALVFCVQCGVSYDGNKNKIDDIKKIRELYIPPIHGLKECKDFIEGKAIYLTASDINLLLTCIPLRVNGRVYNSSFSAEHYVQIKGREYV